MSDYIERDAVLAEYDRQHKGPPGGARKIIAEFPAADVRPNDHSTDGKIVIELPNGYQLVAERNTDPAYPYELFIGITDGNGVWWQDLAVIRNAYCYEGDDVRWKPEEFDVLVYADKYNEDFTHDFTVGLYHGGV